MIIAIMIILKDIGRVTYIHTSICTWDIPVLVISETRLSLRLIINWVPSEGFHAPYHDG